MVNELFRYYTEASIVCIIVFAIMMTHEMARENRDAMQIWFDNAMLSHILYFVSDECWAVVLYGQIKASGFIVVLFNFTNLVFLALIAYSWTRYAVALVGHSIQMTARGRRVIAMPLIIMAVVALLSFVLLPDVMIGPDGMVALPYYVMLLVAPLIYVSATVILCLKEARHIRNRQRKQFLLLTGLYPVAMVIIGIIQLAAGDLPLFCFGTTIVMLYFYVQDLESRISLDPLTRLNNRGQLLNYVASQGNLFRKGLHTFVVMIDANDFKKINDTYGHAEGDRALVLIAGSLRESLGETNLPTFLCRYGGDEFLIIAYVLKEEQLWQLTEAIRKDIAEMCREEHRPYTLSLGIGYEELSKDADTFDSCMKRADKKLYIDKALQKQKYKNSCG